MSTENDQIRTALERKFQPPIDVLLDPSLLTASSSLERVSDSTVFDSQTQATLGQAPTEPRVGDLFVPATFRELLEAEEQLDVQTLFSRLAELAEHVDSDAIYETMDRCPSKVQ